MEPPGGLPPDKDNDKYKQLTTVAAAAGGSSGGGAGGGGVGGVGVGTAAAVVAAVSARSQQLVPFIQSPPPSSQQQQQKQSPTAKPALSLNLPQQRQQQQALTTIAASPAAAAILAAAGSSGASLGSGATGASNATTPTLASAATALSATTQAATAFSGTSIAHKPHTHHHAHHPHHQQQQQQQQQQHHSHHLHQAHNLSSSTSSSLAGGLSSNSSSGGTSQQTIEKLSRPMAFDKMESLVREMQDPEHGVPVRQQKMFLTSIPYAFMGYDLIEWLMDRLLIEESEGLNIANQLCLHGYFFPVNDTKTLAVKDDSSLYRFQTPYYWPWQHKAPDNVEYAIYLVKRSLRNKQRHALEDYEAEALASLHKNLKGKWDFIQMQAEEQVRLAKERKKGDKIVGDSQERAYWRVHRPPPGQFTPLEPCPVPSRDRQGSKQNKKKTLDDMQREVDYLSKSLNRTRMKMSQACESLTAYSETFAEYDFFLQPVLPSNPWVTEDITFWQLNNTFVDIPTEKRVKRWAISIEELVSDPTGLQEFTSFLEKEYSHENIRFWIAVNRLRRSAHSQVSRKVQEIYEEFLKPGAPCEINIDGKTMESVLKGLKNPSRFTFDSASEHIYMLLLKKDCYPRFIRSDHYKRLLETGIQPSHKKRFFNFGGVSGAKKKINAALSNQGDNAAGGSATGKAGAMIQAPPPGSLTRRRGSDRSLTGSAHELAVIGVNKDSTSKVPHSHSQSNLSEIPYSETTIYRGDMPQQQHHQQQQQQPHKMMVVMDAGICAAYGNRNYNLRKHQFLTQEADLMAQTTGQHLESLMALHFIETGLHVCFSLHLDKETPKPKPAMRLETTVESAANSAVCPWDMPDEPPAMPAPVLPKQATEVKLSVCPWEQTEQELQSTPVIKSTSQRLTSTSSDITDVADRMQRNLGIRHQNTVDSGESGIKRLIPNFTEQRRASVSFTPGRSSEYSSSVAAGIGRVASSMAKTSTPSPTVGSQSVVDTTLLPFFAPFQAATTAASAAASAASSVITKDPPSSSDVEDELNRLSISESSASELPAAISPLTPLPTPTPTPPPTTKITPPPPDDNIAKGPEDPVQPQACDSPQSEAIEMEVIAEVQEVQIELIETIQSSDEIKRSRDMVATPTIQVDEPTNTLTDNANLELLDPSPKSPKTLHVDAAVETDAITDEVLEEEPCTPTKQRSSNFPEQTAESVKVVPPPVPEFDATEEEEEEEVGSTGKEKESKSQEEGEEEEAYGGQEELSPTTDEYQEGMQFGDDSKENYDYDIVDTDSQAGYIPPAPTPAPSMAPLAELDVDTVDDELCCEEEIMKPIEAIVKIEVMHPTTSTHGTDEVKKRRKKRNSDGKKMSSLDEKDKEKAGTSSAAATKASKPEADRNTVCPWEDENLTTSDGTFVKTYATLGYL